MRRVVLGQALHSIVAKRMVAVFVICTLVPLAGFAWLTIRETTATLEDRARRTLHAEARGVSQEALGQLDAFSRSLAVVAASFEHAPPQAVSEFDVNTILQPAPRSLSYVPKTGARPIPLIGSEVLPPLSAADERQLDTWGRLIVGSLQEPVLVVRVRSGASTGYLAAGFSPSSVFHLDDEEALPPDSTACVLSNDVVVACSPSADRHVAELMGGPGPQDRIAESSAGTVLVRAWSAPLVAQYGGPTWTLVLMRSRATVLEPVNAFTRNVLLMAAALTLIVTWVSLAQVRRYLRPLDQLMAATQRMARLDFDDPVRIASGDEFEALAGAFNDLSSTLKRQFGELEAFSLGSLAALARAIDAKSPWTAGHSERVTAIAAAIGKSLGLSNDELQVLQRGGLVHDLGKLATPQEILDKPGRLTPEEYEIMGRHPMQGVRILEPIPAFAPLLPIVAEHHEWWNGGGYPRRLAGTAIDRLARVLAVADVYDALRSDRPYRSGLVHPQVVDMIVSGAGRQFDPDVVGAFLSVAEHIDAIAGYRQATAVAQTFVPVEPTLVEVGRD